MKYRMLGKTCLNVSVVGFGASSLGGVYHRIDESEGIRATHLAIDHGINFIDVSPYYGITRAETVLGKALANIPRDRYYLATKIGRYDEDRFDFSAQRTIASIEESLTRLGVEYLDLIQCHDIEFSNLDQIVNETLPTLRKLQDQGKARFVGITGLPLKVFRYVMERADIDTILSYCRYCINDTSLELLLPMLRERNVGVISASPFSMGLLTDRGPPSWHPADEKTRALCAKAAAYCREAGTDIAKLALQFSVALPDITTTLFSTADPKNLEKNIAWLEEPIAEEVLQEVRRILEPVNNRSWPSGRPENNDDIVDMANESA